MDYSSDWLRACTGTGISANLQEANNCPEVSGGVADGRLLSPVWAPGEGAESLLN